MRMKERTLLQWEQPQSAAFAHWLHEFWPQLLQAYLLGSIIATIFFTTYFGSDTIADAFLVFTVLILVLLFQLIAVSILYHASHGTMRTTLTTHGIHVQHSGPLGRWARFASWTNIHHARLRATHLTALIVRKKNFLSDHLLLLAPKNIYPEMIRIFKRYLRNVR